MGVCPHWEIAMRSKRHIRLFTAAALLAMGLVAVARPDAGAVPGVTASLVKNINVLDGSSPSGFTLVPGTNRIVFVANDSAAGAELFVTDGTGAGTSLVKDILPGGIGSNPTGFVANSTLGVVFFAANDGTNGAELWKTDGTLAGTVKLPDINPGVGSSSPTSLVSLGGEVLFSATDGTTGLELWKSNGTTVTQVKNINPAGASSSPANLTTLGTKVLFGATDGTSGRELWVTDGDNLTPANTFSLADISAGATGSNPNILGVIGSTLYFSANDFPGANGRELWKTDGTSLGTVLVKDIKPGATSSINPALDATGAAVFGGSLYFPADDGTNGIELWRSNGTALGTTRVTDINTGGDSLSATKAIQAIPSGVVFLADNTTIGFEPYFYDGTATTNLVDARPLGSSDWSVTAVAGARAFFNLNDGVVGGQHGRELWTTDGTVGGTGIVVDGNPAGDGMQNVLAVAGGIVFFSVDPGNSQVEPWRVDGTFSGPAPAPTPYAGPAPTTTTTTTPPPPPPSTSPPPTPPAAAVLTDGSLVTNHNDSVVHVEPSRPPGTVAGATMPDDDGTWVVTAAGLVQVAGTAKAFGSPFGLPLRGPISGISLEWLLTGGAYQPVGYWLVAQDGGVFNYGAAPFFGSVTNIKHSGIAVGIVPTPDYLGYWIVTSDGGVYGFGDAIVYGSMAGKHLNRPVVGIVATPSGHGYWLVASDGGVFNFGDAGFFQSLGDHPPASGVVGLVPAIDGLGYWLVKHDSSSQAFSDNSSRVNIKVR